MDSLSFRNQQLAKRVELLQEELAASEAKGKKGKVNMRGKGEMWEWLHSGLEGAAYIYLFFCSGLKVMVVTQ